MSEKAPRLVVFCHVHYLDIWQEMAELLADRLAEPFDLVITTSLNPAHVYRPATERLGLMTVLESENRGRDIRPFLQALRRTPDFEIGLKLHTKRSDHRLDGIGWRNAMIDSLVPSADKARGIIDRLHTDRRISMVGADGMLCSIKPWIGKNAPAMNQVAASLGLELDPLTTTTPRFMAGSMFWFRRNALLRFAETDLDPLFEPEHGQVDGTTAHACERLFLPVAELDEGMGTTVGVVLSTNITTTTTDLEQAVLEATDAKNAYLRPPPPLLVLAYRYAPFLVTAYQRLPHSARCLAKAIFAPS